MFSTIAPTFPASSDYDEMLGFIQTHPAYRVSPDTLLLSQSEAASIELMMKLDPSCSTMEIIDHAFKSVGWPCHTLRHVLSSLDSERDNEAPPPYSPPAFYSHNVITVFTSGTTVHDESDKGLPPPYRARSQTPDFSLDCTPARSTGPATTEHNQARQESSCTRVAALNPPEEQRRWKRGVQRTRGRAVSSSIPFLRANTRSVQKVMDRTSPYSSEEQNSNSGEESTETEGVDQMRHRRAEDKSRTLRSERKFRCAECGSGFTIARVLFRHMSTVHGGEGGEAARRFRCGGCGERSSRKDSLQRHQRNREACKGAEIWDDSGPRT